QAIIRSAIADSSASMLAFLSSMGQREAIAFGEGVATTMRMKFEELPPEWIPGAQKTADLVGTSEEEVDLPAIVERLRNVGRRSHSAPEGSGFPQTGGVPNGEAVLRRPY